ncbi:MAG: hypothetical protein WD749_11385 [Phycisphaerales bacterium]
MTTLQSITLAAAIGGVMCLDFLIVWALVRAGWSIVAQRYTARPVEPGAVRRNFQSFSFGLFNFGLCIHVAADEHHLHLTPAAFIRLFGPRPVSIPWDDIRLEPRQPRRKAWARARIGKAVVLGPRWALELAAPAGRP